MKPIACLILLGLSLAPSAQAAPSPTGRNPRVIWTPARQDVWLRMKSDYDAHPSSPATLGGQLYSIVKRNADCTGEPCELYNDLGQWAMLVYQITGQTGYAAKALAKVRPYFGSDEGFTDFSRQIFIEFVLMYDWLYPSLTAGDKQAWVGMFNRWAAAEVENAAARDSDQSVGAYFAMALISIVTAADNPRAGEFLNDPRVGGLTATGTNLDTLRNGIKDYAARAAGGTWFEGSEYNENTLHLVMLGYEGMKTAAGTDYFPEIGQLIPQLALGQIYELSPDLNDSFEWSDVQEPRSLSIGHRYSAALMLAGLTQGDSSAGPYIQRLVEDLGNKYGVDTAAALEGWVGLYVFNPYAPSADWRTLPNGHAALGQGFVFFHDGWTPTSSFLGLHIRPGLAYVDHQPWLFGNAQLYRKGEWALTCPIGYGLEAERGVAGNSMLFGGLSAMEEMRRIVGSEIGANYVYFAGTTGGKYDPGQIYLPPPVFLYEWTRSFLYLASDDRKSDTIVVFDRTNAVNPRSLQSATDIEAEYNPYEANAILNAAAVKQWIVHSPVSPTLTTTSISWRTAGGQNVRVDTLTPEQQNRTILDEHNVLPDDVFTAPEMKFETRVSPANDQHWGTFLNVIQVYDSGTSLTNQLVRSDSQDVEGALVRRGSHNDALVLFNALGGPNRVFADAHLRVSGYTAHWTASSGSTKLYLLDLHPRGTWTAQVDGGAATPLSVSPGGVALLDVAGGGAHTIRLNVGNIPASPPAPTGVRVGTQ